MAYNYEETNTELIHELMIHQLCKLNQLGKTAERDIVLQQILKANVKNN